MSRPLAAFRRTRTIRQEDCDALGHVNNLVWLGFVVDLAEAHSTANGLGAQATLELGGVWVVQRHEIHYRRDARPGDEIEECTWVSHIRGARSVRHARFRDAAGETLVESTTDGAFIDPARGRPQRLPAELIARFAPIDSPDAAE